MKNTLHYVLVLLALSACSNVVNEQSTTAFLTAGINAGEEYQIRTRTFQGSSGTFDQTTVVYRGISKVCILDSPGDCEAAARNLIDGIDIRDNR